MFKSFGFWGKKDENAKNNQFLEGKKLLLVERGVTIYLPYIFPSLPPLSYWVYESIRRVIK